MGEYKRSIEKESLMTYRIGPVGLVNGKQ